MIRLSVPGTLDYRDVAMRVVSAAAKLLHPTAKKREAEEFDAQVVSAFGEAFNNVALHGYAGMAPGMVDIEIEVDAGRLVMRISDYGRTFDPMSVPPPELDKLPERGMGIFIIRSFMDEVSYVPGCPNVLEMVKLWPGSEKVGEEGTSDPKRGHRSGIRRAATAALDPLHYPGRYAKVRRR